MKPFPFFVCLAALLLLIPVGVSANSYLFTYSTPPGAAIYLDGIQLPGVTPRQQNALPGVYTIMYTLSGYPDYTTTVTVPADSTITVDYDFNLGALNKSSISPTLSSITPASGVTNTTVTINNLAGTGFASGAYIRLEGSGYGPIRGSVTSVNTDGTSLAGTFDLTNQAPGTYQVCVYNTGFIYTCGLTFAITSLQSAGTNNPSTNSSVYFETDPPGATVFLDNTETGTSTFMYNNAVPGTHRVLIRKTGYADYSGSVVVLEGKRVTFYAPLTLLGEGTTVATPVSTTVKATPVKTATTIRKSVINVPTSWPSATPTDTSPVDPAIVIGAAGIGIGLAGIRRR
jgi:hypothetical protein